MIQDHLDRGKNTKTFLDLSEEMIHSLIIQRTRNDLNQTRIRETKHQEEETPVIFLGKKVALFFNFLNSTPFFVNIYKSAEYVNSIHIMFGNKHMDPVSVNMQCH